MKAYLSQLLTKTIQIWKRKYKSKRPPEGTMFCILNFNSKSDIHYQTEIVYDLRFEKPLFASACAFRNGSNRATDSLVKALEIIKRGSK
jgi:hypothetical protein